MNEADARALARGNPVHIAHTPSGAPRTMNVVVHFQEKKEKAFPTDCPQGASLLYIM